MARPRVCRHAVRCPECGSNRMPQDGASKGPPGRSLRRLRTPHHPDAAYQRLGGAAKERALAMYQEGSSLSAVARIFGVSVQGVSQWVKKRGPPPGPGCAGGAQSVLPA